MPTKPSRQRVIARRRSSRTRRSSRRRSPRHSSHRRRSPHRGGWNPNPQHLTMTEFAEQYNPYPAKPKSTPKPSLLTQRPHKPDHKDSVIQANRQFGNIGVGQTHRGMIRIKGGSR